MQQKKPAYCDWQSSSKIEVMDVSQRREPVNLQRAQECGHDSV